MANQNSGEGSSISVTCGQSSDANLEINIKTLDSQIYSFQVDKNMLVLAFKEKIAQATGVPVGQQRLIFRGKVLKDEHPLSEYQVENGHTLHLVERQPTLSSDSGSGTTSTNNGNQGIDASAGTHPNRGGQISHSVVLGTFNVGEQGEGIVPDLSRVIGAVLNSFGIGGQAQTGTNGIGSMQASTMLNVNGNRTSQGSETANVSGSNAGGQSQAGNQTQSGQAFLGQLPFQAPPQAMQFPLSAAVPLPSLNSPIPDSLSTISEFMTRMEQTLARNGYQPNTPSNSPDDVPRLELPPNARGLQALSVILRHAERLFGGNMIAALSHIAGRLDQEGETSDLSVRSQIQSESVQVGIAVQHLGALLLELGRTILTLRMGQSPSESSVNPGPAVYISPSGPNPLMVQPFPLQTNSLIGGSSVQSNPTSLGPIGMSSAPRNVNIHIHAGTSLAPVISTLGAQSSNGEGVRGEQGSGPGSGSSGTVRMLPVRNVIATAVPPRPTNIAVSSATQPGSGVSVNVSLPVPPSDSTPLSSVIAEVNSRLRNLLGGPQGVNQSISGSHSSGVGNSTNNQQSNDAVANELGQSTVTLPGPMSEANDQKNQDNNVQASNDEAKENAAGFKDEQSSSVGCSSAQSSVDFMESSEHSSERNDPAEGAQAAPLGLGMGTLERKRRSRQPKSSGQTSDNGANSTLTSQSLNAGTSGQQLLLSLASRNSGSNAAGENEMRSGQTVRSVDRNPESRPPPQISNAQFDASSIMSQVIDSPALNGLLNGVSEQTGVGSPNVLRNMLQQLTQNPQIMSTVGQIAQQVESQDLGDMFSGLGSGQGGGLDLSRMVQQMMPVVSQVLGRGSAAQPFPCMVPETQHQPNERSTENEKSNDQNVEIDLEEVAQRIERSNAPGDIFRAVAENASRLNGNDVRSQDIVRELSDDEQLVCDYMEMLRRDVSQRLQDPRQEDHC